MTYISRQSEGSHRSFDVEFSPDAPLAGLRNHPPRLTATCSVIAWLVGGFSAETERMQELVNHDEFGGDSVPIPELSSANTNQPGARQCERRARAPAALKRRAVIDESQ